MMNDSRAADFTPGWLSRTRLPFLAVLNRLMPTAALRGFGILRELRAWLTLRLESLGRSNMRPVGVKYVYRPRRPKKRRPSEMIAQDEHGLTPDAEESEAVDTTTPSSMEEMFELPLDQDVAPELADYPSLAPIQTIGDALSTSQTPSREFVSERRTIRPRDTASSAPIGEAEADWVRSEPDFIGFPPALAAGLLTDLSPIAFSLTQPNRLTASLTQQRTTGPIALVHRQSTRRTRGPGATNERVIELARHEPPAFGQPTEESETDGVNPLFQISNQTRVSIHDADGDWLMPRPASEAERTIAPALGNAPTAGLTHRRPAVRAPVQMQPGAPNEAIPADNPPGQSPSVTVPTQPISQTQAAEERIAVERASPQSVGQSIEPDVAQESAMAVSPAARQEWPILDVIHRLGRRAATDTRAPLPVLQSPAAISALQTLPTLGPGEPLTEPVKPVMEQLVGRDLSRVRVYSSPAAEQMGAEAFTTGERIVFAPGRMDLKSSRGLALLGHELAHIGQPLGLKESDGSSSADDGDELAARQQESALERVFEQSRQAPPQMELRRSAPPAQTVNQTGISSISGEMVVETQAPAISLPEIASATTEWENPILGSANVSAGLPPIQAPAPAKPPSPSLAEAPDLDALARQVYALLKNELRAERERHEIYRR